MKQAGSSRRSASQAPEPRPLPAPALADALGHLLRAQLESHQRLLICLERKRQAIRTADIGAVGRMCAEEDILVKRLVELEKHRHDLLGRLTQALDAGAAKPLTVSQIAALIPEPQRTELLAAATELREAIGEVRRQSSIVRLAAESLSRHMNGIVQTVHSALSRARVYGSRGTIALGAQVQSTVDLKS